HRDQQRTDGGTGRKGTMGEQAVITHGDAEAGNQPHGEEQAELERADRAGEKQAKRGQAPPERQKVEQEEIPPLLIAKMPPPDDATTASPCHWRYFPGIPDSKFS